MANLFNKKLKNKQLNGNDNNGKMADLQTDHF